LKIGAFIFFKKYVKLNKDKKMADLTPQIKEIEEKLRHLGDCL